VIILYPELFWALLGVIPIVLVFLYQYRRGKRVLLILRRNWDSTSVNTLYSLKWAGQLFLFLIFYLAMVLSLAEISWGDSPVDEDRRSLDISFLVDVSRSMLAEDGVQSRLNEAKEFILGIVQEFPDARFSMAAFKGETIQLVPLTENTLALEYALQALSPSIISSPGTDLERALTRSLSFLPEGTDRHRILVLLSDGGALSGTIEEVAPRYNRLGIPILSLGFGTDEPVAIPIGETEVVRDPRTGQVVLTFLESELLERVAELSAGTFIPVAEAGSFTRTVRWISNFETTRESEGFRLVLIPRYPLFLSIALVALLLSILLRGIRIRGIL